MVKCFAHLLFSLLLTGAFSSAYAQLDTELQEKLTAMGNEDQQVREQIVAVISSLGMESAEFKSLAKEMASIDAKNITELKQIIEQHGWPGSSLVGIEASKAAFLILQHASITDQETFLPLFRASVANGEALPRNLALLEDRIRLKKGQKQIYGSQISSGPDGIPRLDPIEDPANVNKRRESVGLPPIEAYLKIMEANIGQEIDRSALEID